jgi:hypothetical protein
VAHEVADALVEGVLVGRELQPHGPRVERVCEHHDQRLPRGEEKGRGDG